MRGRKRWIALGLVVGVVATWGGFGLVQAATTAPTTVTTCTKVSNSKTKVIPATDVAKCTKKAKGIAKSWADSRYASLLKPWSGPKDLRGLDLRQAELIGRNFAQYNLAGMDLTEANLHNTLAAHANFTGANLHWTDFSRDLNAPGLGIEYANFTNAYLVGADFHNQIILNVNFTNANLDGTNFTGAILAVVAHFSNTTCPDGSNSDTNGGSCVFHGIPD